MEGKHKTFVCSHPDCGKTFSKSSNLTQHMRIHSGEKPFHCEVCGQSFRQSGNLSKHLKGHENAHLRWNRSSKDKPYKCQYPDCGKSFTAKSSLQNHTLLHTGELPYRCIHSSCKQRFAKKGLMTAHFKEVHENSGVIAEPETAPQSLSHSFSHSTSDDDACYNCLHPKCKKSFCNESQLRAHVMTYNPGMVAENAFLLSSLQRLIQCVEAISDADVRIKDQLNSTEFVNVKVELEKTPLLTQPVPKGVHESSETQVEPSEDLQPVPVDHAWALHRQIANHHSGHSHAFEDLSESDDAQESELEEDSEAEREGDGEASGQEDSSSRSPQSPLRPNKLRSRSEEGAGRAAKRARSHRRDAAAAIPLEVACGLLLSMGRGERGQDTVGDSPPEAARQASDPVKEAINDPKEGSGGPSAWPYFAGAAW